MKTHFSPFTFMFYHCTTTNSIYFNELYMTGQHKLLHSCSMEENYTNVVFLEDKKLLLNESQKNSESTGKTL